MAGPEEVLGFGELPEVPKGLSRDRLEVILNGPNGRELISAMLKVEQSRGADIQRRIREAERYCEWLRAMLATVDAMAVDMGDLLSELHA